MNKFLKAGLGFVAMAGLVSGSLFAFNISTSIDNALQVIKTIWVTSDGTTNNPPFVTMDGSGGYVSIGTIDTANTLTVSGSVLAQYNQAAISLSTGFYSGINFYPIPTASLIINDPYATGLTTVTGISAQVSVYDTRAINPSDPQVGATMATYSPGLFDQNQRAEISVQNATEVALDAQSGSVHTSLDVESDRLEIYSSGGASSMYFDGILGLFGFGTNSPQNTIDIGGGYVPGTLGLRFSGRTGNAGQVLGLNNAGDVVLLGTLGGGSSYWTQNGNDMYPTTLGNNIGIGTNTPSETFAVSGTFVSAFSNPYGTFSLIGNNTIFGGTPGAGSYVTSGSEFLFAGVDHDGNKLSAELAYASGDISQFITVSKAGPAMLWQSSNPSFHYNGVNITSTGIKSSINNLSIGPAAFVREAQSFGEIMRINNSGNVGIGTNNPSQKLEVADTARFTIPTHPNSYTDILGGRNIRIYRSSTDILGDPGLFIYLSGINMPASIEWDDELGIGLQLGIYSGAPGPNKVSLISATTVGINYTSALPPANGLLVQGNVGIGLTGVQNNLHISSNVVVPGTLGLRLQAGSSNSGQILGVNDDGDVVMLGNIGGFGGGSSYWTQNGNDLYPTTLTNNVGIGTNTPSETLSLSGTALMENSNRGWEFVNDALVPGINRIGGRFNSGAQYVQNTITDIYNGLPVANMGWFDTNTNEESNFSAFQQSATMHYNSDRTSANSGLRNGIDITPNDVEIKYDQNNISGAYIELNLGPLGFGVSNGMTFTHMFTNSGYVGINNINPSHTLSVSGTFIANDGAQGLAVSPNLLGMGIPGAMNTYASGTQLGFIFAGNPGVNPVFDAGAGAFLGFIDMVGFNDRAILSVKSGSIEFGIDQSGIDEAEFDFNTEYWSIESNSGFDNLWMDFNTNRIGINHASPQKALDVSGAIVSSAMFIGGAGAFSGTIDVQNVNSIFVDPSGGDIDIHGLTNGTVGQVVYIVRNTNGVNNLTIYNNSNSNNADFRTPGSLNLTIGTNRGLQFIYNGWNWIFIQ